MVKLSVPLTLLAVAVASVFAQDDNNNQQQSQPQSAAPSSSQPQSQPQSAAPSSSQPQSQPQSSAPSSSQPQSQSSPSAAGGASSSQSKPTSASKSDDSKGGAGGAKVVTSPVCSALFGDPNHKPLGKCTEKSTSVPPYNLSSLVDYFVGGYQNQRGNPVKVVDVADDLAGSVVKYYPTVTQSRDVIKYSMYNGLIRTIHEMQGNKEFKPSEEMKRPPGAEPGNSAVKNMIVPGAVGVAAAVMGGAIFL